MRSEKDLIEEMVAVVRAYGVQDDKILDALKKVPRHMFVPGGYYLEEIYADAPLPIGNGQTISQPYTVAYMLELLELKEGQNVLEIGAGSGWNAALIKHIVGESGKVTAIELEAELVNKARRNLSSLNSNVEVLRGDGSIGYKKNAPYDRIIVTCAAPNIREEWHNQLKDGGIIVLPLGSTLQEMTKAEKLGNELKTSTHGFFRFVPLR
ncbi:MAG: protein-L-isoaspartate(D-aspartate) O-methyltransferase [Nanoarchaeota archaeon]